MTRVSFSLTPFFHVEVIRARKGGFQTSWAHDVKWGNIGSLFAHSVLKTHQSPLTASMAPSRPYSY